jgi:hypothetical protein
VHRGPRPAGAWPRGRDDRATRGHGTTGRAVRPSVHGPGRGISRLVGAPPPPPPRPAPDAGGRGAGGPGKPCPPRQRRRPERATPARRRPCGPLRRRHPAALPVPPCSRCGGGAGVAAAGAPRSPAGASPPPISRYRNRPARSG